MVNELVDLLVSRLGVSAKQAAGGAGVLLRSARTKLGARHFEELLGELDGLDDLIRRAPGARGLGQLFGGVAAALGNNHAALLAEIVSGFTRLGMQPEQARQFVPVIMEFLRSRLGDRAVDEFERALRAGL